MPQSKDTNNPTPVMSVTPSPYEQLKLFSETPEEEAPSLDTKRLRLECILAAITTGARDTDHLVATAQKFWNFVHEID